MSTAADTVMFTAEFEPAEPLGRRRVHRTPVSLDAKIGRGGLDRALCKVLDLSIYGARIRTYSGLKPGTRIWLTLPIVGYIIATIRWADDFEAGCEFEDPLDPRTFQALARM